MSSQTNNPPPDQFRDRDPRSALDREEYRGQAEAQYNQVLKALERAGVMKTEHLELLKNSEYKHWVMGWVERQGDNTLQFLPTEIAESIQEERRRKVGERDKLAAIRRSGNDELRAFVQDIQGAPDELRKARELEKQFGGELLTQILPNIEASLRRPVSYPELTGELHRYVELAQLIAAAPGLLKTQGSLKSELESKLAEVASPPYPELRKELTEALTAADVTVDSAKRTELLGVLRKWALITTFSQDDAIERVYKAVQERLIALEFRRKHNTAVPERHRYKFQIAGNVPEQFLNFATADGKLDVTLLHRRLQAIPATSSITLAELYQQSGVREGDTEMRLPADWGERRAKFLQFLESRGLTTKTIFEKLSNIAGRFHETLPPEVDKLVGQSIDAAANKINFSKLSQDLGARSVVLTPDQLKAAARLADETITPAFDRANLVSVIVEAQMQQGRWTDYTKWYVGDFANAVGRGVMVWWDWIQTLPGVALTREGDNELESIRKQEEALGLAAAELDKLRKWRSERGPAIIASAIQGVESLQADIDKAYREDPPATNDKEMYKQARVLMETSANRLFRLERETQFRTLHEPRLRRIAFFLAMRRGIETADQFIRSTVPPNCDPRAFISMHLNTHPEDLDLFSAFEGRVYEAQNQSGEKPLAPMQNKIGVKYRPDATAWLNSSPQGLWIVSQITTNPYAPETADTLRRILVDNPEAGYPPGGVEKLIAAYCYGQESPDLTIAEAQHFVRDLVVPRLYSDLEEFKMLHESHQVKSDGNPDWLKNTWKAFEGVKELFTSGDPIQIGLGVLLVGGGIYAVRKAWKAGGIWQAAAIGIPFYFGADLVTRNIRKDKKGLNELLGLDKWRSEKELASSTETFFDGSRAYSDYLKINDPAGREAHKQLTRPDIGISLGSLLSWRDCVKGNGRTNHAAGAPPPVTEHALGPVKQLIQGDGLTPEAREQEGYKKLHDVFEAFCIQVADNEGLASGASLEQRADAGAEYLKSHFVNPCGDFAQYLEDPVMRNSGCADAYRKCCRIGETGGVTFAQVFVWLRNSPSKRQLDQNRRWGEWAVNKTKTGFTFAMDGLKKGWNWGKIQAEWLVKEGVPAAWQSFKGNFLKAKDAFLNWAGQTWAKGKPELLEGAEALWNLLSTNLPAGIKLAWNATTGVMEWLVDTTLVVTDATLAILLNTWRELYRHHIPGDLLRGFEAMYYRLRYGMDYKPIESREVADFNKFERELRSYIEAATNTTPTRDQIKQWIDAIAGKEYSTLSLAEQLLVQEKLKREVFAVIITARVARIKERVLAKDYTTPLNFFSVDWTSKSITNGKFNVVEVGSAADYEYIRTLYNKIDKILPIMGNQRSLMGFVRRWANEAGETATGYGLGFLAWMMDLVQSESAADFQANDLGIYLGPLLDQAQRELGGKDSKKFKEFKAYLDTLTVNVMLEAALDRGNERGPRDTRLMIERAKYLLKDFTLRRGNAPKTVLEYFKVHAGDPSALMTFALTPAERGTPSNLSIVEADPQGKNILEDGIGKAPAVAPTARREEPPPPDVTIPPAITLEAIDDAIRELGDADPAKRKTAAETLLGQLASYADDPDTVRKIRKAFGDTIGSLPKWPVEDLYVAYVLGLPDDRVREAEDRILSSLTEIDHIKKLIELRKKNAYRLHLNTRLQHFMNRAILQLLESKTMDAAGTERKSILDQIAESRMADLPNFEPPLLTLYRATKERKNDALSDIVSHLLELVRFQGKHLEPDPAGKRGFAKYEAYLQANTLTPPTEDATFPWILSGLGVFADQKQSVKTRWGDDLAVGLQKPNEFINGQISNTGIKRKIQKARTLKLID